MSKYLKEAERVWLLDVIEDAYKEGYTQGVSDSHTQRDSTGSQRWSVSTARQKTLHYLAGLEHINKKRGA